jgi:hypothetical protein
LQSAALGVGAAGAVEREECGAMSGAGLPCGNDSQYSKEEAQVRRNYLLFISFLSRIASVYRFIPLSITAA